MFKTILVPTDGSPLSEKAIDAAIEFAKFSGSKIVGVSIAEPYPFSPMAESAMTSDPDVYEDHMRELAHSHVKKLEDAAAIANVQCDTSIALSYNPYEEIIRTAEKFNCDAIFMASHGRKGLSKLFLGSETQKVLAHTTLPVLVLR